MNLALDTAVKSHSSQKFPKVDSTEIKHKLLPQPEKISGDYRDSNERRLFTSLPSSSSDRSDSLSLHLSVMSSDTPYRMRGMTIHDGSPSNEPS